MSLIGNLLRGTAALSAQSKGLEVTGRNIANANTDGYSRQRVVLSAGETMAGKYGPEAMSIRIDGVTQARDQFLDRQVTVEKSNTAAAAAEYDVLSRAQTAWGQTINGAGQSVGVDSIGEVANGIAGRMSEFFNSFQELATNPRDIVARTTVLNEATGLVDAINLADQRLATVQAEATEKINTDVDTVNRLLKEFADLNEKIGRFEITAPGAALDLRDQRQARIEELSQYMNVQTRPNPPGSGQLDLFTRDTNGAEVVLVDRATVMTSVSFTGTAFQAGDPPADLDVSSGSMAGALRARDGFVQELRDDLAKFATQLRDAVNAAYNPGGGGGDFFVAGSGAKLIEVEPGITAANLSTTTTGDGGANDVARAVAAVVDQRFSTADGDTIDGTLRGYYSQKVVALGNAVRTAGTVLEDQMLSENLALSQRDQVSGVSIDEEAANLMKYQRAFQAAARYVNILDEMLDVVVNGLVRR